MHIFIGDVPSYTCPTVESNFSNIHGQITSAVDVASVKDLLRRPGVRREKTRV
jgi:hypothetical protein